MDGYIKAMQDQTASLKIEVIFLRAEVKERVKERNAFIVQLNDNNNDNNNDDDDDNDNNNNNDDDDSDNNNTNG